MIVIILDAGMVLDIYKETEMSTHRSKNANARLRSAKNTRRNYAWRHGTEKGAEYRIRDAARKRAYRKTAIGKLRCSEYEKRAERKYKKKLRRCGL